MHVDEEALRIRWSSFLGWPRVSRWDFRRYTQTQGSPAGKRAANAAPNAGSR